MEVRRASDGIISGEALYPQTSPLAGLTHSLSFHHSRSVPLGWDVKPFNHPRRKSTLRHYWSLRSLRERALEAEDYRRKTSGRRVRKPAFLSQLCHQSSHSLSPLSRPLVGLHFSVPLKSETARKLALANEIA